MGERAPYSRVYWTIRNDDRLKAVYPDDHLLATWLRLLIAADMAWPAPADVPASVSKRLLSTLQDAGVIEVKGGLFIFHGLDSERGRRSNTGRNAAAARWSSPNADRTDTERSPNGMLDETSKDKHSRRAPARDLAVGASTDPRPLREILAATMEHLEKEKA